MLNSVAGISPKRNLQFSGVYNVTVEYPENIWGEATRFNDHSYLQNYAEQTFGKRKNWAVDPNLYGDLVKVGGDDFYSPIEMPLLLITNDKYGPDARELCVVPSPKSHHPVLDPNKRGIALNRAKKATLHVTPEKYPDQKPQFKFEVQA